jgi:hypothetical protein
MNRSPATGRLSFLLVLIAVLGLTFTAVSGSAAASGGQATIAKKCKKAKKGSASAAKKSKCKKKKTAPTTVPPATPPSTVRVSGLTKTGAGNLTVYVWDSAGNEAGPAGDAIPNSTYANNTFTDNQSPSTRDFTVGICTRDGANGGSLSFGFNYVTGAGTTVHGADSGDPVNNGHWWLFRTAPFGNFDPDHSGAWCQVLV